MICFGFLRIFGEKTQKCKLKNLGTSRLLRHSVGNPCCGVDLCHNVGCLAAARPRGQNSTPRVRHGLRRGEGLCRSVAVLRRGVATIHNEKILDCCFESLVFVRR